MTPLEMLALLLIFVLALVCLLVWAVLAVIVYVTFQMPGLLVFLFASWCLWRAVFDNRG